MYVWGLQQPWTKSKVKVDPWVKIVVWTLFLHFALFALYYTHKVVKNNMQYLELNFEVRD